METRSSKQCLWTCWTDSHAIIKIVDTQRVTVAIPTIENCISLSFFAVWAHSCTAHCLSFVGPLRPFAAPGFASTTGMTNFMELPNINTKQKITRRDTSNTYPDRVKALPWKHEWIKSPMVHLHWNQGWEIRWGTPLKTLSWCTRCGISSFLNGSGTYLMTLPNASYLRWLVSLS